MKLLSHLLLTLLVLTTACGGGIVAPPLATSEDTPLSPTISLPPVETTTPPSPTNTPGGPLTLRVWLPPQFDPSLDTPASALLRQRLEEFSRQRSRLLLEVRIKAPSGPGGLLDSLTTASAAAPQSVPDLIALPRDALETAALKGLLYPYNAMTQAMKDEDWYDYAYELASIQDSTYGLPFAGDAMILVYHPSIVGEPPQDWSTVLEKKQPLVFPAADPQALYTLGQYRSLGGVVQDELGKPALDTIALTKVLTYYTEAELAGVMSAALTQYQSDDQVWAAFQENRAPMAITWCSRYLDFMADAPAGDYALSPIPTADGKSYTLATGWVWSLSAKDSERQRVAVELAEFLTESAYLAAWTEAAGYLPPRPSALRQWSRQELALSLDQNARSAHALPSADILVGLSKPLWQAVIEVLRERANPLEAAQEATASLSAP